MFINYIKFCMIIYNSFDKYNLLINYYLGKKNLINLLIYYINIKKN